MSKEGFEFLLNNRKAVLQWKEAGIAYKDRIEPKNNWRNVAEHMYFCARMVDIMAELLELPAEERKRVVTQALLHDKDKRIQVEMKKRGEVIDEESQKSGLAAATSTNFEQENEWGVLGDLLRFADSSVGDTIGSWRDRMAELKVRKADENLKGHERFGMGMWDKLEEVTLKVEQRIYGRIIELHPELKENYPSQSDLLRMVTDRLK